MYWLVYPMPALMKVGSTYWGKIAQGPIQMLPIWDNTLVLTCKNMSSSFESVPLYGHQREFCPHCACILLWGIHTHTPFPRWRPSNLLVILSQGVIGDPTIPIKAGKRLDGRHPFKNDVIHLIFGLKPPLGHPDNNLLVCENHKAYIAQV